MSFAAAFRATWATVLTSRTLLSTMLLAVVLYAFYYPAPYSQEVAQQLPVVLVDEDGSALSRELVRNLEATRAVIVAEHAPSVAEAQAQLRAGKVDGVVLIARGLQRQLRTGAPGAGIAVWVNASYLLRASTIGEAVTEVLRDHLTSSSTGVENWRRKFNAADKGKGGVLSAEEFKDLIK